MGGYKSARLRWVHNQIVTAIERMGVRSVAPILLPRQQSGNQRNLVIERLGDFEQCLAQSAPHPFAIAKPFETGRKLDVVIEVVNRVTSEPLPSGRLEQLGR